MTSYPDGNPKTAIGASKVPLHLVPPSAAHYLALAFENGAKKYGAYNWRKQGVSASVYYDAFRRHMDSWWDGEDVANDSMIDHLAHAMACAAILLDAKSIGMLNDDRPPPGAASRLQAEFTGAVVPHELAAQMLRDGVVVAPEVIPLSEVRGYNPPPNCDGVPFEPPYGDED